MPSGAEAGRIPNDRFGYLDQRLIHRGTVVDLYSIRVGGPEGEEFDREVIRHPGAVAVAAVGDGHIYLVQQYRAALDADLIEIPAGKRDVDGEPPEQTAHRELEEEVGLRAGSMELLLNIHHSPGFCDEYGYVFLATDLEPVTSRHQGPEERAMAILRVPLDEAVAMCFDGRITDCKTVAGILAAAHRLAGR